MPEQTKERKTHPQDDSMDLTAEKAGIFMLCQIKTPTRVLLACYMKFLEKWVTHLRNISILGRGHTIKKRFKDTKKGGEK